MSRAIYCFANIDYSTLSPGPGVYYGRAYLYNSMHPFFDCGKKFNHRAFHLLPNDRLPCISVTPTSGCK